MAFNVGQRAASLLKHSLQARSLNLIVRPHPITFAERRSVLQVIKQHGDLEMFKMMPGRYDRFISITKDEETAEKLVAASPLAYTFTSHHRPFDTNLADFLDSKEVLPKTSVQSVAGPPGEESKEHKTFTLHIFPAPWYNHEQNEAQAKEHKSWPAAYTSKSSFMTATLEQSLPDNIMTQGLARWDNSPDESSQTSKDERLKLKSWMPTSMMKEPCQQSKGTTLTTNSDTNGTRKPMESINVPISHET